MIENYLTAAYYDLVTPDGKIIQYKRLTKYQAEATILIENIESIFVGFAIDISKVYFNIKSTLAQLGLEGKATEMELDFVRRCAHVKVILTAITNVTTLLLDRLGVDKYIGKLFAADDRRIVRDPDYLTRLFGRADRWGDPLLSLGGLQGTKNLVLEQIEGRAVAYLTLQEGCLVYDNDVYQLLSVVANSLNIDTLSLRELVRNHQHTMAKLPHTVNDGQILLVKTLPLHVRTVFAKVVDSLLPAGYFHTSASILQPDTQASGDVYELYGQSKTELTDIPLEFYTLEPYREYSYFSERTQLKSSLEDISVLFKAFSTAPLPKEEKAATFVVKGSQLLNLKTADWISRETYLHELPGRKHGERHAHQIEHYIEQQPSYPFLKCIDDGIITSQGVLLSRYFPSPFMKRMLLSNQVQNLLKGIYFQYPSRAYGAFSAEDRALLHDLDKFAIPIFWVDEISGKILQFTQKPEQDSGLFVPLNQVDVFLKSTVFGIYGSNLISDQYDNELKDLLSGIVTMKEEVNHPLLNKSTPISLVTGGGPGAMELGNKIAKELGILSCANIVDFSSINKVLPNEQKQNPYIEAKMTYRLDKLVERQAEFNLDFPIFVIGGIGTDFEYCLEEVRRKVGATGLTPILLCGKPEYWREKVTHRFKCNIKSGAIKGSEWLSNCFYCIQTAQQGLNVYRKFFTNSLPIGSSGPIYENGFCIPE